jgi:hypothetical protein
MTRRIVSGLALLCLMASAGACASRKEGTPDMPPPSNSSTESSTVAAAPLKCALSVAPQSKVGEPVKVTFRLTNTSAQPLYVLDWRTPLEGLKSSCLEISRAGAEIPYQGPMFKRGNPGADDYVEIAPGATVENTIEAQLAYDFSQPGTYRIAFPGPVLDSTSAKAEVPRPLEQHRELPVQCQAVETQLVSP